MSAITELLPLSQEQVAQRKAGRPRGKVVASANYSIPALWLTLFDQRDLVTWRLDEDRYEPGTFLALCAPTRSAVRRSQEVCARWQASWPALAPQLEAWRAHLPRLRLPYVAVDTAELALMNGDRIWRATLTGWLSATAAGASEAALRDVFENSHVEYTKGRFRTKAPDLGLVLGGNGRGLPWLGLGAAAPIAPPDPDWFERVLAGVVAGVSGRRRHEVLVLRHEKKDQQVLFWWYASRHAYLDNDDASVRTHGVDWESFSRTEQKLFLRIYRAIDAAGLGRGELSTKRARKVGRLDGATLKRLGQRIFADPRFHEVASASLMLVDIARDARVVVPRPRRAR